MTSFLIVVVFLLLSLAELPGLARRKNAGEIAAFAALWAAGLTLSLLIAADVPINGLTALLRRVFEPIGKLVIKPPPT